PKGTLIAYATAPGKVAQDGSGRNGLYTAELLKALEHPGRRIEDIFKQVRSNVARTTGDLQVPWESSSLTGDLYFDAPTPSSIASSHIADTGSAFELEYWRSAEKSGKHEDFRAYLDKYPKGQFVDLARSRLKPTEPAAAPRQATGEAPAQPPATVPADKAAAIQAKLDQADALLKAGNAAKAIAHLEKLLEKLPRNSPHYGQTQYALGFAQAAERRCPDALINLRAASANWRDHRRAATAWQTIVLCERHLKNHPAARQAAQTLLVRYPDSPEAEHIRQRLDRSRGPAK
ncbi:MAG TPA: caspase family protein, partial [Rhodocyclaceae bacterium]|nr:caspase family protein [Rhodocyclaceae bacterium]